MDTARKIAKVFTIAMVLAIIVYITCDWLDSLRANNEDVVVSVLRSYWWAQSQFKKYGYSQRIDSSKKNWYASEITQLIDGKGLDRSGRQVTWNLMLDVGIEANMIAGRNDSSAWMGYYLLPGPVTKDSFVMFGIPARYQKTGINTYRIDETGRVWKKDLRGKRPDIDAPVDSSWTELKDLRPWP